LTHIIESQKDDSNVDVASTHVDPNAATRTSTIVVTASEAAIIAAAASAGTTINTNTAAAASSSTVPANTYPAVAARRSSISSDDDDDDDSLSSRECEETIRAGDIIEYWDPSTFTVGDPRGRGTATVIRVDTVEEEYPLILDNSTLLPNYSKIRRLKRPGKDGLVDVVRPEGRIYPISSFKLEEGGSGTAADGIMKQAGRISDMHNRNVELVAAAARADGSGFAPMDVMVAMNGGTSRERVEGASVVAPLFDNTATNGSSADAAVIAEVAGMTLPSESSVWVPYVPPQELSSEDQDVIYRSKSDWLSGLHEFGRVVTKEDVQSAKCGSSFSVVDKEELLDADASWRRVILKKIRNDEWQLISDTGDEILDNVKASGDLGLMASWDVYYRHPMKSHYDEALVAARKRKADELEDEERLDISPNRKKRREDNFQAKQKQGRTMMRDAKASVGGDIEVKSIVKFNLHEVDCTKVDPKTLTFVVVQKKEGRGSNAPQFRLANSAGVLKGWIHQSHITPVPNVSMKLMQLEAAYEGWKGMSEMTQREIAAAGSMVGGQGKKKCGCKGNCNTNKCCCYANGRLCGSSCHQGKDNSNCKNCEEA